MNFICVPILEKMSAFVSASFGTDIVRHLEILKWGGNGSPVVLLGRKTKKLILANLSRLLRNTSFLELLGSMEA